MAELQALGARSVPIVSQGEKWVYAQLWKHVVDFLDLEESTAPKLAPPELFERTERYLHTAQRLLPQFPLEQLDLDVKGRKRSLRALGFHIFRLCDAFVACLRDGKALELGAMNDPPPPHVRTGADLAAFGDEVLGRLHAFLAGQPDMSGTMDTYYGVQPVHEVQERITWHIGQHVRQLTSLLEERGIVPDGKLEAEAFRDLPMPEKVWDD